MKKSRYTETQIVMILKEVEADRLIKEVYREYGISDATYYNWMKKYNEECLHSALNDLTLCEY